MLIDKNPNRVREEIFNYHKSLNGRTLDRIQKLSNFPEDQHTIPKFILAHIATSTAPYGASKGLTLQEYFVDLNNTEEISLQKSIQPISLKQYSTHKRIYNSDLLGHPYFIEVLFSIVEGDASQIIRSRLNDDFEKIQNPFHISTEDYYISTKNLKRVVLSTFLAMQSIRTNSRKVDLITFLEKYLKHKFDFATAILLTLRDYTLEFYERQWAWIRLPENEMIMSKNALITFQNCSKHSSSLMPLSRRDAIYCSDVIGSHYLYDDKIFIGSSEIIYNWIINRSFVLSRDPTIGVNKYSFVANKESNMILENFYTPYDCCLAHVIEQPLMGTSAIGIRLSNEKEWYRSQ